MMESSEEKHYVTSAPKNVEGLTTNLENTSGAAQSAQSQLLLFASVIVDYQMLILCTFDDEYAESHRAYCA